LIHGGTISSGRFSSLGHFRRGRGGDVVQVAAVSGCLFGGGLQQRGLQGQQFLSVLGRQSGLGGLSGFAHRGLGHLQVQLDELFNAFEGLGGQAEQRVKVGLLRGDDLFCGQHEYLLEVGKNDGDRAMG
jgi:hypothetical protein